MLEIELRYPLTVFNRPPGNDFALGTGTARLLERSRESSHTLCQMSARQMLLEFHQ